METTKGMCKTMQGWNNVLEMETEGYLTSYGLSIHKPLDPEGNELPVRIHGWRVTHMDSGIKLVNVSTLTDGKLLIKEISQLFDFTKPLTEWEKFLAVKSNLTNVRKVINRYR